MDVEEYFQFVGLYNKYQERNESEIQAWKDLDANTKKKIAQILVSDVTPHETMYTDALEYIKDWNSNKIYLWKMADTDALVKPYIEGANILIIGDASHAIMPTIGMGASLAIEDAELIAYKLSKYILNKLFKTPVFV